jgi:glutamyl-tRNA reductase
MTVLFVGTSHATAPLETIERLGFSADDAAAAFARLTAGDGAPALPLRELVILSTCHRVELYAVADDDVRPGIALDAMTRLLCDRDATNDQIGGQTRRLVGTEAARHLFRVACGLESIVLGETEVLAQVQAALAVSLRFGAAGQALTSLFESAARVGRRARAETSIATAAASVSSIAAELAEELADELRGRRALFVGTAKVGRLAAKALRTRGYWDMSLIAATPDVTDLAQDLGAAALAIEALPRAIADSDLVVTCASVPTIDAATVRQAMRGRMARPIAFIDLAAGSGLEPDVAELAGVRVVGPAELRERIDLAIAGRRREAPLVETIIEEALRAMQARADGDSLSGVVAALRARAEEIRQRELGRALRALPDADSLTRAQMEWLSVSLVNKLLDEPTRRLRAEASHGATNPYADATRELFGLSAELADRPPA